MLEDASIDDIVFSYLMVEGTYIQPHNMISLEYPFDITSNDYLDYSRNDLASNDINGTLNALSNAKRALESRIDSILHIYGIKKVRQKIYNLNSFSQKVDLLKELGVVAPDVMKKINTVRNRMEHDYIEPEQDMVCDFIDIIQLFLESTQMIITRFINEFSLDNDTEDYWLDCLYEFNGAVFDIEINYKNKKPSNKYKLQFDRKNLEFNHTFQRLFELVYKVTLNPSYKF